MKSKPVKEDSIQLKKQHDFLAKILVIGDGGVGKTSLITRFTEQKFINSYTATIGVDFKSRIIKCQNKNIKLQIWDTAGQERFRNITQAYYRGSAGILLTFSVTDQQSLINIEKWIGQMDENAPKQCCKLLVGSKSDCEEDRVINRKEAEKLAIKIGVNYIETSAKTGDNVDQAFIELGRQIFESSLKKNVKKMQESMRLQSSFLSSQKEGRCRC